MAIEDVLGLVSKAGGFKTTSKAIDVVSISQEGSFSQILADARPLTASLVEKASLMQHPVETGSMITDHIVIHPVTIEITYIIAGGSFDAIYQQFVQLFYAGTLLSIQTKTGVYSNQVIAEMPHEESAQVADGISLKVRFSEARMITPEQGNLTTDNVSDSSHSNTVSRGSQQTTASSPQQSSAASSAYSSSSNAQAKGSTLHQWFGS